MSIIDQINAAISSDALDRIRAQAAPMHAIYKEMERQGFTEKQTYNISSIDVLALTAKPTTSSSLK